MDSTSRFSSVSMVEVDEIVDLARGYDDDKDPNRTNLITGVYATDDGQPWPLPVVAKAEMQLQEDAKLDRHDYLPLAGDPAFLRLAKELSFGVNCRDEPNYDDSIDGRIVSLQTVAGTGANHVGARFLAENIRPSKVWLSNPTWANHYSIWKSVNVPVKFYPYYNATTGTLDLTNLKRTLEEGAEPNDIIVLQACAHNPTGIDPTEDQWRQIAVLCQQIGLFCFFDNAYQGFASGDPVRDAWAIQYFLHLDDPVEMCVAQSFSKNFGLYGHRVGAFHLVIKQPNSELKDRILSAFCHLSRVEYGMAPRHGSTIVKTVLERSELKTLWYNDLKVMNERIRDMRERLQKELVACRTPGDWKHITNQCGMFLYTGLQPAQVAILRERFHIYMLRSGRMSVAGLNKNNVAFVARSIQKVLSNPEWKAVAKKEYVFQPT